MLKGYSKHGKEYFIHGNRGRKPANTIPDKTRNLVADLYRNKYYDANFEHKRYAVQLPVAMQPTIFSPWAF